MGNKLHRSSASRSEGSKVRLKREKRKPRQKMGTILEGEGTIVSTSSNLDDTNGNLTINPSEWTTSIELQQHSVNSNDPPGAPSTFSPNFSMAPNDVMTQSWSSHYDGNNQFYNGNGAAMPAGPMNLSYEPNQHAPNPNLISHASQPILHDDGLQKKVQFAHQIQHQGIAKAPLTGTLSWHESIALNNDPGTKRESVPNRPSIHRSGTTKSTAASLPAPAEKPIYVGIDHRATLAERGQTTAQHRQQKAESKNSSETGPTQRTRSHTHHPHHHHHRHHHDQKQQESTGSPPIKANTPPKKSLESLQNHSAHAHRPLTTTSTSTVNPTKQSSVAEHAVPNSNESKSSNNRRNHPATEQQGSGDGEKKLSRAKSSHSQPKQQRQRTEANRTHSPTRNEPTRRPETKQPTTTANSGNVTRTRV